MCGSGRQGTKHGAHPGFSRIAPARGSSYMPVFD